MTTESRREFEEWAKSNTSIGLDLDTEAYQNAKHYCDNSTYAAWEAWQAAREQVTEQRDRLVGEIVGWRNKWECAVEMAAQSETELFFARKVLLEIENASHFDNIGNWARNKAKQALKIQ
jgi:hypothetical protein